jgi:hypothetical protein
MFHHQASRGRANLIKPAAEPRFTENSFPA